MTAYNWTITPSSDCGDGVALVDASVTSPAVVVTWDPAQKATEITLSGANLIATGPASNINTLVFATRSHSTGKYYFEVVLTSATDSSPPHGSPHIGVMLAQVDKYGYVGADVNGWGMRRPGTIDHYPTSVDAAFASASVTGDVVMVAVDLGAGKLWYGRNGAWLASGDPVAGTNAAFTDVAGAVFPVATLTKLIGDPTHVVTARFASADWGYAAPSGFGQW